MRYVSINTFPNGSTGAVMWQVTEERLAIGDECWCIWGRGRAAENDHEFNFGSKPQTYLDALQTRFDGRAGFHSLTATRRLLGKLDEIAPDIVHLHNIHGYYVNIEMLFNWLNEHENVQIKWTLHDCWAFTGHCAYFTYVDCTQWKTHCGTALMCPQLETYPKTYNRESCKLNYVQKKRVFTQIPSDRMEIITPSKWMKELVCESFLSKYDVRVRHNTINKEVFKPTKGNFRDRNRIGQRFMILCVASPWSERKGLKDIVQLSKELDPNKTAIVIVGLNRKQIRTIPRPIIALERTNNMNELAELYSTADILFNPTKEDNYPTVNLEAEACGTAVVVYDVGGCKETIHLPSSRIAKNYDDAISIIKILIDKKLP